MIQAICSYPAHQFPSPDLRSQQPGKWCSHSLITAGHDAQDVGGCSFRSTSFIYILIFSTTLLSIFFCFFPLEHKNTYILLHPLSRKPAISNLCDSWLDVEADVVCCFFLHPKSASYIRSGSFFHDQHRSDQYFMHLKTAVAASKCKRMQPDATFPTSRM